MGTEAAEGVAEGVAHGAALSGAGMSHQGPALLRYCQDLSAFWRIVEPAGIEGN
jgi:hypothetical protein